MVAVNRPQRQRLRASRSRASRHRRAWYSDQRVVSLSCDALRAVVHRGPLATAHIAAVTRGEREPAEAAAAGRDSGNHAAQSAAGLCRTAHPDADDAAGLGAATVGEAAGQRAAGEPPRERRERRRAEVAREPAAQRAAAAAQARVEAGLPAGYRAERRTQSRRSLLREGVPTGDGRAARAAGVRRAAPPLRAAGHRAR